MASRQTDPRDVDSAAGACCGPRALCGWSPPALPADSARKRRVDRALRSGVAPFAFFGAVIALLVTAPNLPLRGELAMDDLAALAAGAWCGLNFWRCRHAHCAITAAGWFPLSAFVFIEAGIGRSLIARNEQLVFLAVLGVALAFEGIWYLVRGTNALTRSVE
jgi:hypothetical protein